MRQMIKALLVLFATLLMTSTAVAQSAATAQLHVSVKDPNGGIVKNATVTLRNEARNIERAATNNVEGVYQFLAVPPGQYTVSVQASGFATTVARDLTLTIGQAAELPVTLRITSLESVVNVSTEPELVETQRSASTTTIDQTRIDSLPINGRNYINFTLTDSKLARDNTPNIPVAPTSGLNFGGARARANLVNVDGADAVDNSTNGIRATVSQEAVQEFQIITNNYAAEYGRASGGVVNIITRSGTNAFHGSAYGFLRNRNIQAVNHFSNVPDPAYTRAQAGIAAGGPIKKDRTFFYFSYETTRRQESGFSNIGVNNFDLVPYDTAKLTPIIGPGLAPLGTQNFGVVQVTSPQSAFLDQVLATFNGLPAVVKPAVLAGGLTAQTIGYLTLTGGSSGIALNRAYPSPLMYFTAISVANSIGVPAVVTPACAAAPQNCPSFPESAFPLPPGSSFLGLNSQKGNFPVTEGTTLVSLRLDHRLTTAQQLMLRVNVSPSTTTGNEVSAQGNQTLGLNSFTRVSDLTNRDLAGVVQHEWTVGTNKVNEFRFQYARRGQNFTFSHAPGGGSVGDQVFGFAFIGREPFSPVVRTEQRFQFTDNFSISHGKHTFKWGGDVNYLPLIADFTVNFGGVYNFADLPSSILLPAPASVPGCPVQPAGVFQICIPGLLTTPAVNIPGFSAVQAYGLGFPQSTTQGVGNPHDEFSNKIFGGYIQDTWRVTSGLTLNLGVRYDVELTPTFAAATSMSAAAETALGIAEGIPRDYNNFAPRVGVAWDPWKDGKTVIRASYGLFYDHPLLALAFDSDVADGSQAPQFGLLFGKPGCGANIATAVNSINVFQGLLGTCPALGPQFAGITQLNYLPQEQRFNPTPGAPSAFTNQQFIALGLPMTFLPDGFPVARNFQYAYSNQANFSIEHDLGHDFAIAMEYNFNGGRHLNRPIDTNFVIPSALLKNFNNCLGDPICVAQPLTALGPQFAGFGGSQPCNVGPGGPWIATPILNFFRRGGLNPSFVPALQAAGPGGQACLALANQLMTAYGLGFKDASGNFIPIPFLDMGANLSDGSSVYHAFSANLRKRMSNHYEFLASYTWSHAIDDSTDLETPLAVQDPQHPGRDRSNSLFDQRHRFVFSAVYQTGRVTGSGLTSKLLSDWTFAPIVDVATGRPFPILSGTNSNLDSRSTNDRPNAVPANYVPPAGCNLPAPVASTFSPTGFLQPACFFDANFGNGTLARNAGRLPFTVFNDLRVSRRIHLTERLKLDGIMDLFNLANKYNVKDANFIWNQAGQATAAYDPRQFQFALRLTW